MTAWIIPAAVILGVLLLLWIAYRRGRKDEQRNALLKSAEEVAVASVKVSNEARKAAHEIEKLGPDTSVDDGNKLLTGG